MNGLLDTFGNYYKTVTIGTQTWMAENLNTGTMKYFTGEYVLSDSGEFEKYCYDNNPANCDVYGGLYSWGEMMDYVSGDEGVFNEQAGVYEYFDVQGICPEGWHIPVWVEWETLFSFVGKAEAGVKFKADSPIREGDPIKTDEFGFGVLPGGGLFISTDHPNLGFHSKGSHAVIWKATGDTPDRGGQILWLKENTLASDFINLERQRAAAVRCIKDPE